MRSCQPGIVSSLVVEPQTPDGGSFLAGLVLMRVSGDMSAILMAERVALNFAGRMSGIATLTSAFVAAVGGRARVTCTRKTTPGQRLVEKAAVRHAGGCNHRYGLGDAIRSVFDLRNRNGMQDHPLHHIWLTGRSTSADDPSQSTRVTPAMRRAIVKKFVICLLLSLPLLSGCVSNTVPNSECPKDASMSNRGANPNCV